MDSTTQLFCNTKGWNGGWETDPSTSLVVARYDDLLLLHGKRKRLEVWLLALEDARIETVLRKQL